ncbi:hypothetical protein [Thermococcus sp.]|uniref:hypothetical protein n=1 Tax=Thermococcus sp. TaxID=35749 RepID=UPI00262B2CE0|nr:hypothetical protein [Thermococcus sp.]
MRTRVLLVETGEGIGEIALRDCYAAISGAELLLTFQGGGEKTVKLKTVEDVRFDVNVPPVGGRVRDAFSLTTSRGELVLATLENPLLYDEAGFRALLHSIFESLLNGHPVKAAGIEEKTLSLNLIPVERDYRRGVAFVLDEKGPFFRFTAAEAGHLSGETWILETEGEPIVLTVPGRRARQLLLRYFMRFSPDVAVKLRELYSEFPDVKPPVPVLNPFERAVFEAVLNGTDPLAVPALLGADVVRVEEAYDSLIRKGLLKVVGIRKVVEPTATAVSLGSLLTSVEEESGGEADGGKR